ncbi:hypothetical protein CBR_g41273 [Chara braunii]|uniref:beta-fructofuranosidase n=1 Tax=Chara braunii TaxID=69332 RepID=A0A388LVK2_CHABU|nr:hypothetical protein CBR_g41273 [Chara braunii]|eukprot:GBG86279.1 hypothetical protein CBR_g41273 [Chara braunii]
MNTSCSFARSVRITPTFRPLRLSPPFSSSSSRTRQPPPAVAGGSATCIRNHRARVSLQCSCSHSVAASSSFLVGSPIPNGGVAGNGRRRAVAAAAFSLSQTSSSGSLSSEMNGLSQSAKLLPRGARRLRLVVLHSFRQPQGLSGAETSFTNRTAIAGCLFSLTTPSSSLSSSSSSIFSCSPCSSSVLGQLRWRRNKVVPLRAELSETLSASSPLVDLRVRAAVPIATTRSDDVEGGEEVVLQYEGRGEGGSGGEGLLSSSSEREKTHPAGWFASEEGGRTFSAPSGAAEGEVDGEGRRGSSRSSSGNGGINSEGVEVADLPETKSLSSLRNDVQFSTSAGQSGKEASVSVEGATAENGLLTLLTSQGSSAIGAADASSAAADDGVTLDEATKLSLKGREKEGGEENGSWSSSVVDEARSLETDAESNDGAWSEFDLHRPAYHLQGNIGKEWRGKQAVMKVGHDDEVGFLMTRTEKVSGSECNGRERRRWGGKDEGKGRLCHKEFTGMVSRAAKHFVQSSETARCKHSTGEIAAAVRKFHPSQAICPLMMKKLNEYYRMQGRPPVAEDPVDLEPDQHTEWEGGHDTPSSRADYRAGPTPEEGSGIGLGSTSIGNIAARTCTDDEMPSKIAEHLRGPVLASARPPRPPSAGAGRQQTSMAAFVGDELKKEFDQAIASFFFEIAIAFNAARSDSYKNMERIMNEAARSRKMLKLPGYNFLRRKALSAEYKTVDTDLDKIREPWDVTGLTLMTDGTTTTSNRPVINFIVAGDSEAIMVKSVDMEGKDKLQTSMAAFVVDELKKEFDQAIASFFFENAIAFNAARSDSYKNMERIMNEAARSRKMLKLLGYNFLRTKALSAEYKTVDTDLDKIGEPWDVTGLTLMTDGVTTTSNRPVINFIAAGDSGAIMVKSVDMEGKDKLAPALARMWEEVIRELGVHRVNAICTDSAPVNISARKILANHDDPTIRNIPWVPCACHVCNLLMCDIASVPWIAEVILQGREITTFIKRHQRALAMFRRAGREYKTQLDIKDGRPLELILPGETRFDTNFVMLQRLREVEAVLLAKVSHACWDDSPWDRTAASRALACKDLIRDPAWWLAVERACTLLQPLYSLTRDMDRDGRMGMQVWSLGITLEKRMAVLPMDCETRAIVMKKVKERVRMMALPVHAAAWMLHPLHRSPRLFDDLEIVEIMNTLAHFVAVYTKNSKEYKVLEVLGKFPSQNFGVDLAELRGGFCMHSRFTGAMVVDIWEESQVVVEDCSRSAQHVDNCLSMREELKLLRMSKMKIGFVNTERLEWETPEDLAPYDGFMQDREYDPEEVKRRAANWSKSRGRRSKSTKFDIRELKEERVDDGAWVLDLSYRPRRLADHDRGKTVVDVDGEQPSHDNEDADELVRVELVDRRSTMRLGGGSSSSSPRDHITTPEEGVRLRRRTSILGGAASVQGTASLSGAQLTSHLRPTLEEAGTARGTTPGGSVHVPHDRYAVEVDASVGADMDGPIAVAQAEADAVIDARGDDPVGEHGDDPGGATATDGVVGAVDDGAVGANTGTDDGPIASADGLSTPDPGLRLGERFASLVSHVAPIAPRGSAQDFCKHLASMSPMWTDDESNTPDWARFSGPTPPTLWSNEDIPLPPNSWMNDPNGPIFINGLYHLFYQHNPSKAAWDWGICWGHAVSTDLVHWEHRPLALTPTPGTYDQDGIFSGCCVNNEGVPTILYTGVQTTKRGENVKVTSYNEVQGIGFSEVQCIATFGADGKIQKHAANPVINAPPPGLQIVGFRDPFVWKEGEEWFMLLGSGIQDVGGTALLYKSPDLIRWEYVQPICMGNIKESGKMWECPLLINFGKWHMLCVSPDTPANPVLYWVGVYERGTFTPKGGVKRLDLGNVVYAPNCCVDNKGRQLLWGWVQEVRSEEACVSAGYAGCLTLPRVLSMNDNGVLFQEPPEEIKLLRTYHLVNEGPMRLVPVEPVFYGVRTGCLEVEVEVDRGTADAFGIDIREMPTMPQPMVKSSSSPALDESLANPPLEATRAQKVLNAEPHEGVLISYDFNRKWLEVSWWQPGAEHGTEAAGELVSKGGEVVLREGESLKMRVFLDRSVVEVFVNGLACLTTRMYRAVIGVALLAKGGDAELISANMWEMGSMWDPPAAGDLESSALAVDPFI